MGDTELYPPYGLWINDTAVVDTDDNATFDGQSGERNVALQVTGVSLLTLLAIVGGLVNAAVLLVFVRKPALRNMSNRYVMNLLAINLVSCVLLPPLACAHLLFAPGAQLCLDAVGEAVTAGVCASSTLGVLLIAGDQYRAVLRPLQYHATRSASSRHRVAALCMLTTWLGGLVCALLSLLDWSPSTATWKTTTSVHIVPLVPLGVNFRAYFTLFFVTLFFFAPVFTLCWMYGCIYTEAHKNSKRARRNGSTHECAPPDLPAPSNTMQPLLVTFPSPPPASPPNRIVSSLRHRISNASLFKYREEARAARISFLVIFMSLICWSPYCITLILSVLVKVDLPSFVFLLNISLLASTSLVSPLLFAYRSRRLQREVKKLMLCKLRPHSLPSRGFLRRYKWRKRAVLAAVAAATLAHSPEKPCVGMMVLKQDDDPGGTTNLANPADTSRSSFSSGTTQGTNCTDIE